MEFQDPTEQPRHLRPVFKQAYALYKQNLYVFLPIGLIFGFGGVLDRILFNLFDIKAPVLVLTANILINAWASIALIYASARLYKKRKVTLREALNSYRGRYWMYLSVSLTELAMVVCGILALIIPGIYLATIFVFANVLVILENTDLPESFRRSARIVKRDFWHVLRFYMMIVLILVFPQLINEIFFKGFSLLYHAVNLLIVVTLTPFFSVGLVSFYYHCLKLEEVPEYFA